MKKLLPFILAVGLACAVRAQLQPPTITLTWISTNATIALTNLTLLASPNSTYTVTNQVLYSQSVTQDLTGVFPALRVGSLSTNLSFTGTVVSAANGIFVSTIYVPTASARSELLQTAYFQLQMTNVTVKVIYPGQQSFAYLNPLQ